MQTTAPVSLPTAVAAPTSAAVVDTAHLNFSVEIPPTASSKDRTATLDQLCQILAVLGDVAKGKSIVDWGAVLDPSDPAKSAAEVETLLARPTTPLGPSLTAIAALITTPEHLVIVSKLSERYRLRIRDVVLQQVLQELTTSGEDPLPPCARMMVALAQLELVLQRGVATTLETLLKDKTTRRAAIAVVGKLAELGESQRATVDYVRPALESISDPSFAYDVLAVRRHMRWTPTPKASLAETKRFPIPGHHTPVVCSTYYPWRDELITAGRDGSIVAWQESGQCTLLQQPSANILPVAMDGSAKGNLLAVACLKGSSSLAPTADHPPASPTSAIKSGASFAGCIQAYVYSENAGAWSVGDVIRRPTGTAITSVRCVSMKGAVLCFTESNSTGNHVLFFGASGQESRRISAAHDDVISATAIGATEENGFWTGSRDTAVRLWDLRAPEIALRMKGSHHDTVSSIVVLGEHLVATTSLDRTVQLWDVRTLSSSEQATAGSLTKRASVAVSTPIDVKVLDVPIVKAIGIAQSNLLVLATTTSLQLLSVNPNAAASPASSGVTAAAESEQSASAAAALLPSLNAGFLQVEDIVSNVRCTDLRGNYNGSAVMCAAGSELALYALQTTVGEDASS